MLDYPPLPGGQYYFHYGYVPMVSQSVMCRWFLNRLCADGFSIGYMPMVSQSVICRWFLNRLYADGFSIGYVPMVSQSVMSRWFANQSFLILVCLASNFHLKAWFSQNSTVKIYGFVLNIPFKVQKGQIWFIALSSKHLQKGQIWVFCYFITIFSKTGFNLYSSSFLGMILFNAQEIYFIESLERSLVCKKYQVWPIFI